MHANIVTYRDSSEVWNILSIHRNIEIEIGRPSSHSGLSRIFNLVRYLRPDIKFSILCTAQQLYVDRISGKLDARFMPILKTDPCRSS